jgi:F0F1-type ATP synthase membrane subunit b/b'
MAYDIPPKPIYSQVQKAQNAFQDLAEETKKQREEAEKRKQEIEQATNRKGNPGTSQRK